MLDDKYLFYALILLVIALVVGIGLTLFAGSDITYETINISDGTTIEVPQTDDATWTTDENGIKTYQCPSKNVVMNTYNSAENSNLGGDGGFSLTRDVLLDGANDVENYNGYEIKENDINGSHFYVVSIANEPTHDNIVIASEDLDILKHMLDSLVFGSPAVVEENATNTTDDSSTNDTSKDTSKHSSDNSKSSTKSTEKTTSNSDSNKKTTNNDKPKDNTPSTPSKPTPEPDIPTPDEGYEGDGDF